MYTMNRYVLQCFLLMIWLNLSDEDIKFDKNIKKLEIELKEYVAVILGPIKVCYNNI